MKKENYCVDVDLKSAPIIRQTLELMGEKFNPYYKLDGNSILLFSACDKMWFWGAKIIGCNKEKITFGKLIDLLSEPQKIAVKVENEKEFKALMKYFKSKGFVSAGETDPLYLKYDKDDIVAYHNKFYYTDVSRMQDYEIIKFSDFAAEHNIKLPHILTHDGVDLFIGDYLAIVWKVEGDWKLTKEHESIHANTVTMDAQSRLENERKLFSTKQAALDWIEAQKPKEIIITLSSVDKCIVTKDKVNFNLTHGGAVSWLDWQNINNIYDAFMELKKK